MASFTVIVVKALLGNGQSLSSPVIRKVAGRTELSTVQQMVITEGFPGTTVVVAPGSTAATVLVMFTIEVGSGSVKVRSTQRSAPSHASIVVPSMICPPEMLLSDPGAGGRVGQGTTATVMSHLMKPMWFPPLS